MLALSLALFAAPGAVMGYLMPLLEHVTGVSGPLASTILVAYGVANVAGSFLGGRLADANAARALVVVTLGLVTSSAVLYLARASRCSRWPRSSPGRCSRPALRRRSSTAP